LIHLGVEILPPTEIVERVLKVISDVPDTDQPDKTGILMEVWRESLSGLARIHRIDYTNYKNKPIFDNQPFVISNFRDQQKQGVFVCRGRVKLATDDIEMTLGEDDYKLLIIPSGVSYALFCLSREMRMFTFYENSLADDKYHSFPGKTHLIEEASAEFKPIKGCQHEHFTVYNHQSGMEEIKQINFTVADAGLIKGQHFHERQKDLWFIMEGQKMGVILNTVDRQSKNYTPTNPALEVDEYITQENEFTVLDIPRWVAHGYVGLTETRLLYGVTNEYVHDPEHRDEGRIDPNLFDWDKWSDHVEE